MRVKYKLFPILFIIIVFLVQCQKEEESNILLQEAQQESFKSNVPEQTYIFLGHIYDGARVQSKIEEAELSKYDQIWLGGDLLANTTKFKSNLDYLDTIFNLSSPNTLWAVGNHDVKGGNINWITEKTKKPFFYSRHKYGITYIVLNTNGLKAQSLDTSLVDSQYNLIKNVCDTISNSSHLVLISHFASWNSIVSDREVMANYNATEYIFKFDSSFINYEAVDLPKSTYNYFESIYLPLLESVNAKGIKVVHLAGDFGIWRNIFDYETHSGIRLLGCGILPETQYFSSFRRYGKPDSVLVFRHDVSNRELSWERVDINDI